MVGVTARVLAGLALAGLQGCATVPESSPSAMGDAGDQRAVAALLDAVVAQIRSEVDGLALRVRVAPDDALFSRYARLRLDHGVREGGGSVSREAPFEIALEVRVAGRERAERNLILPLGQYVRLPLYYGQHDQGALAATLRLEGPEGARTWEIAEVRDERTSYVFRVILLD